MSLYLQVAIGGDLFLVDAGHIVEVSPQDAPGDGDPNGLPAIDLRRLFAAAAEADGSRIRVADAAGTTTTLVVDRVDGLAEIDPASFRALPPIGPLGTLIDAVAMRPGIERPLLRLRGERALAVAAALA
ncbi:MAG TPA: hypothetical protein VJR70_02045 [Stellaceae bacterium]|nr:hypothetical protein [Stellaceae bacterium]